MNPRGEMSCTRLLTALEIDKSAVVGQKENIIADNKLHCCYINPYIAAR